MPQRLPYKVTSFGMVYGPLQLYYTIENVLPIEDIYTQFAITRKVLR